MVEGIADRRQDERRPIQVLGWMKSPGKETPEQHCVVSKDLSLSGAQLTAPVFISPESGLHISLQLHPAGGPMECDGEVCWSQMMEDGYCHFGVHFRDLEEHQGTRLDQFLEAN